MGPASISQEYKSTPTICHNRTTVVKASVPSTGIAANFEVFDDFINLLLAREKAFLLLISRNFCISRWNRKRKIFQIIAYFGTRLLAQLFWDFIPVAAWYTKNDKWKSAQKFNAQNTDYLQKCRNLKNPKTAATIALSTAKPTNSVLTDDI